MTINPFGGVETSGWSDVDVTFTNVRFGQSPSYTDNNGDMPVVMLADLTNEDGASREDQILSIGKGFEVIEGGAAIQHINPRHNGSDQAGFGNGSKGQVFLDSLAEVALEKLLDHFEKVGCGPRKAAFWEALKVHYVETEVPFGRPDEDGVRRTYRQPKATALIGWAEGN